MLIIALDDEPLALSALTRAIAQAEPTAEVLGFSRSSAALQTLAERGLHPDAAFLDIEMPGISGLELALRLKENTPRLNIVFVSGYSQYALEAAQMYASGYMMKPVTPEKIRRELDNLRHPLPRPARCRLRVQCFGNFDVFVDEKPLIFTRSKAKELFAYLVCKRGTACKTREMAAALFEDKPYDSSQRNYLQTIIASLLKTFTDAGEERVLVRQYGNLAVDVGAFDCDFYRFLRLDTQALNSYTGEFMSQYAWAEFTIAYLDSIAKEL